MDKFLTPLVELDGILAKLECENPTGSSKDRAVAYMVADAKAASCIIEPTSGNTGIALAARLGNRAVLVMPESMSPERVEQMARYGAEIVLTPAAEGMAGAIARAARLVAETPGSRMLDQFNNPANAQAHYCTTGPELWRQSGGKIDIFVCCVGTGGTVTGTGRYLKERNPLIKIVAVEPFDSPVLSGGKPGSHGIQGIGAGFIPGALDTSLLDGVVTVTQAQAETAVRTLWKDHRLWVGISSGAAYHAARRIAEENPGKTVATIFPDSGDRYASYGFYA